MKNLKWAYALLAVAFIAACTKDDDTTDEPDPNANKAGIQLSYDFDFGTEPFNLNQAYVLDSGGTVRFTLATFYLSQPALMDDAGTATPLMPEYLIVRPDDISDDLGTVEPGHAHMFRLSIGIDEATNTENGANGRQPTDFTDPDHPLAPQAEGMYWSWASGYIFVKIEGEVDYESDGVYDNTFKYHLGTNPFRKDRSTMLHTSLDAGQTLDINLKVDYEKFLEDVNMRTEILTMSMGDQRPLAEKMMNQFDSAVSFSHAIMTP